MQESSWFDLVNTNLLLEYNVIKRPIDETTLKNRKDLKGIFTEHINSLKIIPCFSFDAEHLLSDTDVRSVESYKSIVSILSSKGEDEDKCGTRINNEINKHSS